MATLLALAACALDAEVGAECLRLSEVMAQPNVYDWLIPWNVWIAS